MYSQFILCFYICVHISHSRNINANDSAVLITKYAKVAHWGASLNNSTTTEKVTTLQSQSQGRSNNGQSFWTHRSDVKIANRGQKPSVVYATPVRASNKVGNKRKSEHIPGVGEVFQDRFNPRPYFDYTHVPSKVIKNNAKSENGDSKMPDPPSFDSFPVFSTPKPDLYTSGYNSYNPPKPQMNVDAPPSSSDIAYPPNAPPPPSEDSMYPQTQSGDDNDDDNNSNSGYSYNPPPPPSKDTHFEDSPHPPPPPDKDEDNSGFSYDDHPPREPEGPPVKLPYAPHPPENHHEDDEHVYYPPSDDDHQHHQQEVILDHPPPGWKEKPMDSMPPPPPPPTGHNPMMMEKPTHDMAEEDLSPPPSDPNYEGRFPQYLYSDPHGQHDFDSFYDHDHHHVYKEITTTTEAPEDERVNKGHYSYYYLGRKLWYIPLYFSVYFIIYVTVLILKSIARHKIEFKHNFHYNREAKNLEEKVDDLAWNVTTAIDTSRKKFEYLAM